MRKSTKLLWGALLVAVMLLTASMGVFAEGAEPVTMTYTSGDAVAFLNTAIQTAEEQNTTVNVVLQANMTINSTSVVGVAGRAHKGQVNIYSEVAEGATPTLGIEVAQKATLKMYGNFNFDNLVFAVTKTEWSGGACYLFVEGMGTIGHDQTNGDENFGNVVTKNTPNLAGHFAAYTGSYRAVGGNYYASAVTVDTPYVKLAGNAQAQIVYGGIHNNVTSQTTTKITGKTDIYVLDAAKVTTRFVGGDLQPGNGLYPNGANVTFNTTGEVKELWYGSYFAGNGQSKYAADKNYIYNIQNVTIPTGAIVGTGNNRNGTQSNFTATINISGGTYNEIMYFSYNASGTLSSSAAMSGNMTINVSGGTFNKEVYFGGNLTNTTYPGYDQINKTITISGGTFKGAVYCGSNMTTGKAAYHNTITTVTITNGTFSSAFYGGSFIKATAEVYHAGSTTLNYQGGSFVGSIYNGSKFDGATSAAAYHSATATITVSGSTFSCKNFYGGSGIYGTGKPYHSGNTTITVNGATIGGNLIGGSYVQPTTNEGTHSGRVDITVNEGSTLSGMTFAGSYMASAPARHTGDTTLTIQGGTSVITTKSHISGGSYITVATAHGQIHSGASTVTFRDCVTADPATGYTVTKNLNMTAGDVFGGSQIDNNSTHAGNTKVEFINCYYSGARAVYAGSRMDGISAVHSGTTELKIDGSEWGYYKALMHGGSFINGSKASTNTALTRQTGFSKVSIIGPAEKSADDVTKQLIIAGNATDLAIYGAHRYGQKAMLPQTNDSEVVIEGYIDEDADAETRVYGGSYYRDASMRFDYANFANNELTYRVPTTRVILKGESEISVAGGFCSLLNTGSSTNITTIKQHSAVVLKDGGKLPANSYVNSYTNHTNGYVTQDGVSILEVYSTSGYVDGDAVQLSYMGRCPATRGIKFIGDFEDTNDDGKFTLYSNIYLGNKDVVQANNDEVSFAVLKTGATTTQVNKTVWQPYEDREVFFLTSAGTIATLDTTQIEVNPTMSVADVLATTGLKIVTRKADKSAAVLVTYADLTQFDGASTSPNALQFYLVDEEGVVGNATANIPASPKQKVAIKSGTVTEGAVTSLASTLNHAFKVKNKSLSLASSLTMNFKIMPEILAEYGYTDAKVVVVFGGEEVTLTEVKVEDFGEGNENNRDYFEFKGIAPQGMVDKMTITLKAMYGEEAVEAYSFEYSVKEYCMELLAKNVSDELNTLVVDLLNYGAATQVYGSYKTDALVNADLTETQQGFATGTLRTLTSIKNKEYATATDATVTIAPGLSLDNAITLRYKVTLTDGVDTANLKLVVNNIDKGLGEEITFSEFELISGNTYYAYFTGITPDQVSDQITAVVMDGENAISNTYLYSVESYAYKFTDASYGVVADLVSALIKYSDAAKAYVASLNA